MEEAKIGVLMLDTTFPRLLGDIGNGLTFPFPVKYALVKGATVNAWSKKGIHLCCSLLLEGALALQRQGVQAITTSCGFLSLFQKEIEQKVNVLFYASSLIQIPFVFRLVGKRGQIGVMTASKASLSSQHFKALGIHQIPMAVEGMDNMPEFTRCFVEGQEDMDADKVEKEVVGKAKTLVDNHPDVRAIVLECTNMSPYKERIKKAVNLPVFDIVSLTEFVYAALP